MIDRDKVSTSVTAFQAREEVVLLEVLKDHVIESDEEFEEAGEFVKRVKVALRDVDAARTELTAPIRAAEKWVNDQFRPVLDRLRETESALKRLIGDYTTRQRERQRQLAAEAAALAAQAVTREEFVEALQVTQQAAPAVVRGVSTRMVTKFRIVDPKLVPRDMCSPDEKIIGAAVGSGRRDIPGVEVFEEPAVTIRAGR